MRFGGLLYLTSTDGVSSGGKRPERALAAYGACLRPLPSANEQGLRALAGAAVREGAARGVALKPLFSYYSFHGPVFRVMLAAERGRAWPARDYAFVGHCHAHGASRRVAWRDLGEARCECCRREAAAAAAASGDGTGSSGSSGSVGRSLTLSGPMWTGPLHDAAFVAEMAAEAARRGWAGHAVPVDSPYRDKAGKNNRQRPLEELLSLFAGEADPKLPPWYLPLDDVGRRLDRAPAREELLAALKAAGFAAARTHVEVKAIKTDASLEQVVAVAEGVGYKRRRGKAVAVKADAKAAAKAAEEQAV